MSYNISVVQMRMIEDFAGAYRNQVWVWYLGWRVKCSSLEVRNSSPRCLEQEGQ